VVRRLSQPWLIETLGEHSERELIARNGPPGAQTRRSKALAIMAYRGPGLGFHDVERVT